MEENKEKKKLSYEELENVCHQLSEQARTLYQKLQDATMTNMFKRLDYLFAVLDNCDIFAEKYPEFLDNCVKEIVNSMTIPEDTDKAEDKDGK